MAVKKKTAKEVRAVVQAENSKLLTTNKHRKHLSAVGRQHGEMMSV